MRQVIQWARRVEGRRLTILVSVFFIGFSQLACQQKIEEGSLIKQEDLDSDFSSLDRKIEILAKSGYPQLSKFAGLTAPQSIDEAQWQEDAKIFVLDSWMGSLEDFDEEVSGQWQNLHDHLAYLGIKYAEDVRVKNEAGISVQTILKPSRKDALTQLQNLANQENARIWISEFNNLPVQVLPDLMVQLQKINDRSLVAFRISPASSERKGKPWAELPIFQVQSAKQIDLITDFQESESQSSLTDLALIGEQRRFLGALLHNLQTLAEQFGQRTWLVNDDKSHFVFGSAELSALETLRSHAHKALEQLGQLEQELQGAEPDSLQNSVFNPEDLVPQSIEDQIFYSF